MERVLPFGYSIVGDFGALCIPPDMPLVGALEVMDRMAKGLAFVTGDNGKLLGVLADSDMRKFVIRGGELHSNVSEAMNRSPKVLQENFSVVEFLKISNNGKRRSIPVVNRKNTPVALVTSFRWDKKKSFDNYVVIMVGGKGNRLRPLTEDCPKPMLRLSDRPLLEIIITELAKNGFHRFILAINYLSDYIVDHFKDGSGFNVSIEYVMEEKEMGTAGALGLIKQKIEEPFFVMNGDLLTKVDFRNILEFHAEEDNFATVGVVEYEISIPYGVFHQNGHVITGIIEKPVYKYHVNSGIYLFAPGVLDLVSEGNRSNMTDLLNLLLKQNRLVMSYPITEYWLDIGRKEDYKKANIDYIEHFK